MMKKCCSISKRIKYELTILSYTQREYIDSHLLWIILSLEALKKLLLVDLRPSLNSKTLVKAIIHANREQGKTVSLAFMCPMLAS